MSAFVRIVGRELRLALRQASDSVTVVVFFVLAALLFPFGIGPEPQLLARIAAGVVLATALLAAMLSFDRLFLADYEDGSLELLALAPLPLEATALAKCLAHWLTTGVPLIVAAPMLGAMLNLESAAYPALLAALLLATPSISLIGGVGAALTLGARRGGVLLPLLVLPLTIPVLIFAAAAIEASATGLAARPHLAILAGLLLFSLVLAPWAAAAALRQAIE